MRSSDTKCTSESDPWLFKPEAIDPETAKFNTELADLLVHAPPVWSQPPAVTRKRRETGGGPFGPLMISDMAVDRTIAGPAGPLTLRTFVPDTVTGVCLHFHGGGFVLGRPQSDMLPEILAKSAGVAIVSLDYRLAPEDPYPAGPDDCEAAAVWLIEHAVPEFGSSRLLLGGESAGAHLSAATLIRMRDKHQFHGFTRANLIFGSYDLALTPSAQRCPDESLVINRTDMQWFYDQFVSEERRRDPAVSPLWADLRDLPAALFTVGTLDPLLDDTLFMHARWAAAGNTADLAIYQGGVHGFVSFPYALAQRARQRMIEFLKE